MARSASTVWLRPKPELGLAVTVVSDSVVCVHRHESAAVAASTFRVSPSSGLPDAMAAFRAREGVPVPGRRVAGGEEGSGDFRVSYFEVKVDCKASPGPPEVAIGVTAETPTGTRGRGVAGWASEPQHMVGWWPQSWALHSDDGRMYQGRGTREHTELLAAEGCPLLAMGCGVVFQVAATGSSARGGTEGGAGRPVALFFTRE